MSNIKYKTLSEQFIEEIDESYKKRFTKARKKIGSAAKKAGSKVGDFAKKVFWDTDDRKYHDRG